MTNLKKLLVIYSNDYHLYQFNNYKMIRKKYFSLKKLLSINFLCSLKCSVSLLIFFSIKTIDYEQKKKNFKFEFNSCNITLI